MRKKIDELTPRREERDAHAAHLYRVLQAKALLKLFAKEHGRPAETTDELGAWSASRKDLTGAIDPLAVLTKQEIVDALGEAIHDALSETARDALSEAIHEVLSETAS